MSVSNEPKYFGQEYIGNCVCCGKKIYNIEDMKKNVDEGVTCVLKTTKNNENEIIIFGGYGSTTYDYNVGHVNDKELYDKIKKYMKDNDTDKAYMCDYCCANNSNKLFATEYKFGSTLNKNYYFQQVPKKCQAFIYSNDKDKFDLISLMNHYIRYIDNDIKIMSYDDESLTFSYEFKDNIISNTIKSGEVFILYAYNLKNYWYNPDMDICIHELNYEIISEEEFHRRFTYIEEEN